MGMKCQTIASGQLFEYGVQPLSCPASSLIARSCPGLCYVGSSVGTKPIPNESEVITSRFSILSDVYFPQLFQFKSLIGFSLITKRQRPAWIDDGTWNLLSKLLIISSPILN